MPTYALQTWAVPTPYAATMVKSAKAQTELWMLLWRLGWAEGASSAEQFIILLRTICVFQGVGLWTHSLTVIDIQFIWLHWMLLKDERLKRILSPDNVSFIFSCERCRLGLLYDPWCNIFTQDEKCLSGIMSHRNIIKLKAVALLYLFHILNLKDKWWVGNISSCY